MSSEVDWAFARTVAGKIAGDELRIDESFEADMLELTTQAEGLVEAETGLVSTAGAAKAKATGRMGWIDANIASFDRLLRPLLGRIDEAPAETGTSNGDVSNGDASNGDSNGHGDGTDSSVTDSVANRLGPVGDRLRPYGNAVETTIGSAFASTADFVGPKVAGAEVGALLGWMSGRVLGQYDLLIIEDERPQDQDWVYYVAPNLIALEERYGFPSREFRLWVAVHECTHRAQFTGVPWLRPYFLSLVNELIDTVDPDPKRLLDAVREARSDGGSQKLKDGGLSALMATPAQQETMDKVSGLMSLLEGHGDITMDRAAKHLIPNQARFSRVMSYRRKNASGITKLVQRLTGMEAKLAQYEEGESFVHAVEAAGGRDLFDQVWTGPEALPTLAEVREPELWITRMGAPAGV